MPTLPGSLGPGNVGRGPLHAAGCVCAIVIFLVTNLVAQLRYFPPGALTSESQSDAWLAAYYSACLTAFSEPSLLEESASPTVAAYRFLWLRSFNGPIAVRVDLHADGTAQLTVKTASTPCHFAAPRARDPASLKVMTRVLTKAEMADLASQVQRSGLWGLQRDDPSPWGFDGAFWLFEFAAQGRYHAISRWSPTEGPVRSLGLYFLFNLAHLKIPSRLVY